MSDPNNYNEPKAADRISAIKKDVDGARAGNTSNVNFIPEYAIILEDGINISDSIVVGGDSIALADGVNLSDSIGIQSMALLFRVIGGDVLTFEAMGSKVSDVVGGTGGFMDRERLFCKFGECG